MKKNLNQLTADRLDRMNLSAHARDVLNQTDINLFYELFGDCETAGEVEEAILDGCPKYFLDDDGNDHWTLYTTADREEVCSVYGPDLDGYEDNWQKALEDFFCEEYGIAPEEWEIG